MPSYSKNEVVLVRYPFSNLSSSKVRPAVVVSGPHPSKDVFITDILQAENPIYNSSASLRAS